MHFHPLLSDSFHLFIFFLKKREKSTFNVDVTALKFSLCLQNRWRVIMPAGQTSLTARCSFLPSLKPVETPECGMSKWMCWHQKHFPTALPQWETVPTLLPTHESPLLSNTSSSGVSSHQDWC